MKILPLRFFENGYMKETFAFGGSLSKEQMDNKKIYPASLQNYLIDTGKEIILVDTGVPAEMPTPEEKDGQMIFMGSKIASFTEALNNIGYKIADIDKIILTHKHQDHSGELKLFDKAKIFISEIELEALKLEGENIEKVSFKNGQYFNFEKSEKISEGVFMIQAYGHTKGNSIVIVEDENLYYMIHGDITYTDTAFSKGYLSVVFEDLEEAKKTLDNARKFAKENKTVYLSTHTPESLDNLQNKKIISVE